MNIFSRIKGYFRYSFVAVSFLAAMAEAGPGLADGATKFVGSITTRGQVRSDFGTYWNQITAENECKWASIEGTRGRYNWSGCDAAYNWAKQNGAHFKFRALVWGSQYPNWLNGISTDETKKAITAWFDAVAAHYPDLDMIDVVNEAIKSKGKYHSNFGSQGNNNIIAALGGDNGNYEFVVTAFKMARERWPKAILIYNDYNTIQWQKNEGIELINKLKAQNAPVDAYGLQARDNEIGGQSGSQGGSCMKISTLQSAIDEIWTKTQMPMFISEYGIGTDDDNAQKNCYAEHISYFMKNEHIAGITIWGYVYGATDTPNGNSGIIKNDAVNGWVDRPAMTWLKENLPGNKGVNTTGLATGELFPADPEPQVPFNGEPFAIPGKIEAEDFDVPGIGINEDGTSNASYGDDAENHGDSEYRSGTGADLYIKGTGIALGYNSTGEWYEYTVDVTEAGKYIAVASVAVDGEGAFTLSIDGEVVGEFNVTGVSYDDFLDVKQVVTLPAGRHILRFDVTSEYFDVDYFEFYKAELKSGAVTVATYRDSAYIDGNYKDKGVVDIPTDIPVDTVVFDRTFEDGKASTIVLPFSISVNNVEGAKFCVIDEVVKVGDVWKKVMGHELSGTGDEATINANQPYLLIPTASQLVFHGPVTLNTSEKRPYEFTKDGVKWEFRGTYHYFDFANDSTQLVGTSYGFAAKNQDDGLKIGDFKVTSKKSYIPAMRAYLVYSDAGDETSENPEEDLPQPPMSHARRYAPQAESLSVPPESMDVIIVTNDSNTTFVGTLNTVTGQIHMKAVDRWFDLQGRVLQGKPAVKGRYLHNGKIEIIK